MDQLKRSLLDAPIIEKNGYHYFVHPISDGVPMLRPELLREIVIKIIRKAELEDVDKIVTPAAMGIHISTAVSLMTDIPLVVVRKRQYGLDGEVSLAQVTGYSGERDVRERRVRGRPRASSSTTCSRPAAPSPVLPVRWRIGADICDTSLASSRRSAARNKLADAGYAAKTLINVDVVDGEVVIVDEHGDG